MSLCVPAKTVSIGPNDPEFITPLVNVMLKKRNKLRKKGRVTEADELAQRINHIITDIRSNALNKAVLSPKELWSAVNKTRNKTTNNQAHNILRNPDIVNTFFAKVAFKENYDKHELDKYRTDNSNNGNDNDHCNGINEICTLHNYEVEKLLSSMKLSASGCDDIPAWLLRTCSFELADIIAHIMNCSINSGKVPSYWLNALVTPVPKVSNPASFSDFRPISVTPLLSRLTEKLIVRRWILPVIPSDMLRDQFAFKPTGSTTAALSYFMHKVTNMLENNYYVRCLMIDFSKAFDTVDHAILVPKLLRLDLPVFVVNWICSFLSGRSQQCKVNGRLSSITDIGLSIVQGSGIGPVLYALMKSDLYALSKHNDIFKYADDTTLLVPEHTDVAITDEFEHIKTWAIVNKLILNAQKTKEIIFRRPRVLRFHMPPALDDIEQLNCVKLLGILFQNNLKMDAHVHFLISV